MNQEEVDRCKEISEQRQRNENLIGSAMLRAEREKAELEMRAREETRKEIEFLRAKCQDQIRQNQELCRIIEESFQALSCDRTGLNELHDLPQGIGRMSEQTAEQAAHITKLKATISDYIEAEATRDGCCRQVAEQKAREGLEQLKRGD